MANLPARQSPFVVEHDEDSGQASGGLDDSTGATTNWTLASLDFSSITGVNNNQKFVLKIVNKGQDTTLNGNDRYDNVTVEGDTNSLAGMAPLQALAMGYNLYPNPSNEHITVVSPSEGVKLIEVCNMMGQVVSSIQVEGKQIPVDISALSYGVYFIHLTEKETGIKVPLKLIKN